MKNLIILIVISALFQPVYSQTTGSITGIVEDENTGQPLIGTNVLVMDTNLGAAADRNGVFTITDVPVGTYRLRFTYIGYEAVIKTDVVVKSAGPAVVNAQLKPGIVQGEGVTVRGGYFAKERQVQPSTIALSREEIRRFPGGFEDVVRTVSTLPGVAINNSEGRNDLLVRGGGPSENLYLINNIEVPNINHFGTPGNSGGSLSFVNLDFVEDVAFSTGGFGARYGDKMSSVIALTLQRRPPLSFRTKLTVSATQYGFNVETPLQEKGNVTFSARKSYLDLIFRAAGLPFVPVYTDFNVIMNYELSPKDRLFVLGLSAINTVSRDQSSLKNRVFNAGILDNSQYRGISGINYRRLLPKGYMDITAGLNLTRFKLNQIDENEEQYFTNYSDEWESQLKIQHFWAPSNSINILTGLSGKWIRNSSETAFADTIYDRSGNRVPIALFGLQAESIINNNYQKAAGFAEADWRLSSVFEINAGIRADYYDFLNEALYIAPRLAVKFQFHPLHRLRLSGGTYYQSPSYTWVVNPGNRSLRALKNQMAVLGWDFDIRYDTRVSIEGYRKIYSDLPAGIIPGVTDYIVMTNTGTGYGGREDDFQSFGYYRLVSKGKGEAYGAELLLQKKFSDIPLYGLFGLSYNKTEITAFNGKTYPGQFDQRWILNVSGGYIFNDKWEASGKFRYFTGIPFTPVYLPSQNPVKNGVIENLPEEYLSARLAPGHHLDIRIDRFFNFAGSTLIVYVDIQNVYNYRIPLRPAYNFWDNRIINTADIGILPSIGISYDF